MHSLSWVLLRRRCHLARYPGRGPIARSSDVWDLPLTELEPLARSRPPRLLALHHPRIARQQALLPQLLAVLLVRQAQRARDPEPQRARLPRHAPATAQRPHVERTERVGGRERLLDVRHQRRPGEVV